MQRSLEVNLGAPFLATDKVEGGLLVILFSQSCFFYWLPSWNFLCRRPGYFQF